ncbi:hypothetical protein [Vallitalea guaymasensis]|uniref:hypothetical protein n=1 Tax=Vallitalea guaymasensis TaxID=1185412 RepID=UPI000DE342ED|nr:hypothetical protein [Vallitalea guaymasensis]
MAKARFNLSMNVDLKKEVLSNAADEELNVNQYLLTTHRLYSYFKKEFTDNGELKFFDNLVKHIKAEVKSDLKEG